MDEEAEQQRITFLLQEIDGHICAAHRSATEMCQKLRRHNQLLKRIRVATSKWKPLFDTLGVTDQMGSNDDEEQHKEEADDSGDGDDEDEEDAEEKRQRMLMRNMKKRMLRELEEREEEEEVNSVIETPLLKTTELLQLRDTHQQSTSRLNISMNSSITSETLPTMATTPYVKTSHAPTTDHDIANLSSTIQEETPGFDNDRATIASPEHTANEVAHVDQNSGKSSKKTNHSATTRTPRMSPPKTQLIELEEPEESSVLERRQSRHEPEGDPRANGEQQEQQTDEEELHTPVINKNLLKSGAFGLTPIPRATTSPRRRLAHQTTQKPPRPTSTQSPKAHSRTISGVDVSLDMSPPSPELPKLATLSTLEELPIQSSSTQQSQHQEQSEQQQTTPSATARKRKRSLNEVAKTTSPQAQRDVASPQSLPSPPELIASPAQLGLRRKYNLIQFTSPSASMSHEPARTPAAKTNENANQSTFSTPPNQRLAENSQSPDEASSPNFEMTSPLLRTRLIALTPGTPISNRIVGASEQIGSAEQEATICAVNALNEEGRPPPPFDLSLFPNHLQRGIGAIQISTVYGKFQRHNTMNLDQLLKVLPDYGSDRLANLLDTLVSRRLLRPFAVEGIMYWQLVNAK